MTSNLANCLMVNHNLVYYPDPGNKAFRIRFNQGMVSGVTATALDVWVGYHCEEGEIHCATAAKRLLPAGKPWWQQDETKEKWRDEK